MFSLLGRPRGAAALVGASAIALVASMSSAYAQEQQRSFNIPAQPLSSALIEFSRQSDVMVVANPSVVNGRRAPALQGSFTPTEALNRLLAGSGLTASQRAEGGFVLASAASPTRLGAADPAASGEEEIIVTAQKREERLEDVPISISVLSGVDLDRSSAQGVTEALNTIPGVSATETYSGGGTQVTVRGVTASGPIFDGSSPIAYYLDGVPFGFIRTAIAPDASAYDLSRVEVLRGPQGTLYGASALNGVVRVLTNDADLDEFGLNLRGAASVSEYGGGNYRGDVALNVPIVPGRLAARAVLGYQDLGGWIDRPNNPDANDADIRNFRLKLNAEPTEQLTVGLSAWLSRANYGAPSTSADNRQNPSILDESISTDYDAYGLQIGYDFGGFSLTSMTSHLAYENDGAVDFTPIGLPAPLVTHLESEVFSQEVLLSSDSEGSWRWSLGGIYRDAEERTVQNIPGVLPAPDDFSDASNSHAVFGEVTRIFFDGSLELTAGLRYFEDDVEGQQNETSPGVPPSPLIRTQSTFDKTTPRLVLTWHPGADLTLYASYAEGFRSGINQTPSVIAGLPTFPPLAADTLRNYELGAKGAMFNGRLRYDAAIYYIDWQDVQQTLAVEIGGLFYNGLVNGESASGMGFDLAVAFEPIENLELGLNFSHNGLEMDAPVLSSGFVLFEEGDRLNRSPEYTAGASAAYSFQMGGGFEGIASASANYLSEQLTRTIFGVPSVGEGDATLISRASFTLQSPSEWAATLFVENLGGEDGATVSPPFGVDEWNSHVRPRTVGLQLEYRY